MKLLLSVLAVVALSGSAALAEDASWTGPYGGLSMATSTGLHDYGEDELYDLEGPSFGAFAGFLWGNGNLVYGPEFAYTRGGVYEVETDGSESYKDDYEYDRFLDLKGRLGYAAGNLMVYGTLGISRTQFNAYIESIDGASTKTSGLIYGVGADYKVKGRFFVGAEYLRRNYDFYEPDQSSDIDAEINTFTLRAGVSF